MDPVIPTSIAIVLPILGTLISSWLADDHQKPGTNALLALAALVIVAVLCMLLSGSIPLTWPLRISGVLLYIGVLMHGDLSVLYKYLQATTSPITAALGLDEQTAVSLPPMEPLQPKPPTE